MEYLKVADLKKRLKDVMVRPPANANRDTLLRLCAMHGVITETELLTTRNKKDTRQAWLTAALERKGCTLREDSRVCQAYIEDGIGDLETICNVMCEMKFYFAHTNYEAIRDEMYNQAHDEYEEECDEFNRDQYRDYEFRPRFNFDSSEASEWAKFSALKEWIASKPNANDAFLTPDLPNTLKNEVREVTLKQRYYSWSKNRRLSQNVESIGYQLAFSMHRECAHLDEISDESFENNVYVLLKEEMARELYIDSVKLWICTALGTSKHLFAGKALIKEVERFAANEKEETNTQQLETKFGGKVAAVVNQPKQPFCSNDKPKPVNMQEKWQCNKCSYTGGHQGLLAHSNAKHNIVNASDIDATLVMCK